MYGIQVAQQWVQEFQNIELNEKLWLWLTSSNLEQQESKAKGHTVGRHSQNGFSPLHLIVSLLQRRGRHASPLLNLITQIAGSNSYILFVTHIKVNLS